MCLYKSGFSRETKPIGYMKRFILRNWLMRLWGLASPKCVRETRRLETQAATDVAVLTPKYRGQAGSLKT